MSWGFNIVTAFCGLLFRRTSCIFLGHPNFLLALGLLVATYPFLIMAIALMPILLTLLLMTSGGEPDPSSLGPFFGSFFLLIPLMMCISFIMMGMQIFYIIQIVENTKASKTIRILTKVGLFFLPFVAIPAYFLTYILPNNPPEWSLESLTSKKKPFTINLIFRKLSWVF